MRGLQVVDGTFYLPETDLLTPPPSPPSVVQLGVTGVPPVERSVAMQMCPYTVSTRQGKPCLLFRACRYSSGLIQRGLCGLWRCCLHLMLRRYCRFFQAKSTEGHARGWLRSGSSEKSSVPQLTSRHERRRLWHGLWVVRCPHLWSRSATFWLCLVDIGTPTKSVPQGSCIPDWPLRRRSR